MGFIYPCRSWLWLPRGQTLTGLSFNSPVVFVVPLTQGLVPGYLAPFLLQTVGSWEDQGQLSTSYGALHCVDAC